MKIRNIFSIPFGKKIIPINTGTTNPLPSGTIKDVSGLVVPQNVELTVKAKPFTWNDVFSVLDELAKDPNDQNKLAELTINIRLETGHGIAFYKGTSLTDSIDSWDALIIKEKLEKLVKNDEISGKNYFLVRQLFKSLRIASEAELIDNLRGIAEDLDERTFPCGQTSNIRRSIHSRLNPTKNIVEVQALLAELEKGMDIYKKNGSTKGFGPMLQFAFETKPYIVSNIEEAYGDLKELEQIMKDLDLHDTNPREVTKQTSEISRLINNTDDPVVATFKKDIGVFLSLINRQDIFEATLLLGKLRYKLWKQFPNIGKEHRFNSLSLDIALEKLGYLLYSQVIHSMFDKIDMTSIGPALMLLKSIILSVRAKGQGDIKLELLYNEITQEQNNLDIFFTLDRINRRCVEITKQISHFYKETTIRLCKDKGIRGKTAPNAFINQMIRGTTIQHLADLISKIRGAILTELETKYGSDYANSLARTSSYIFGFSHGDSEGGQSQKYLLGNKGANLAEMSKLGFPVPPGFIVSTEIGIEYLKDGILPAALNDVLSYRMKDLENDWGKKFGDENAPLIVSVRGGSPSSMPGMLDTILNVGLNDITVKGLANKGGEYFAYDCYMKLLESFATLIYGISQLEIDNIKHEVIGNHPGETLSVDLLKHMIERFKEAIKLKTGEDFPQDPRAQMLLAMKEIFNSWNSPRAIAFRKKNDISDHLGSACIIQAMVFGNLDSRSGTGVVSTRNCENGSKSCKGEFLPMGQGDQVRSGGTTPRSIGYLENSQPGVYKELAEYCRRIEAQTGDIMDVEFTVESGILYLLQMRKRKEIDRSIKDKIMQDMQKEGLSVKGLLETKDISAPLYRFDPGKEKQVIARGFPGARGVATGKIVLDSETAIRLASEGNDVILVRTDTSPNDFPGLVSSKGVLTTVGGTTSHAAENARTLGIPCVTACEALTIDNKNKTILIQGKLFNEGDEISIDGNSGQVLLPLPLLKFNGS